MSTGLGCVARRARSRRLRRLMRGGPQDALVNMRVAVQKMEAELAAAEAAIFKCACVARAHALRGAD